MSNNKPRVEHFTLEDRYNEKLDAAFYAGIDDDGLALTLWHNDIAHDSVCLLMDPHEAEAFGQWLLDQVATWRALQQHRPRGERPS